MFHWRFCSFFLHIRICCIHIYISSEKLVTQTRRTSLSVIYSESNAVFTIDMQGLIVLDYLVAHGSERVIDEIKEHSYQIAVHTSRSLYVLSDSWIYLSNVWLQFHLLFQTLSDFQYISSSGRDEGSNVRKKSQNLVALVNDKERIQEVRQKAHANRDKWVYFLGW